MQYILATFISSVVMFPLHFIVPDTYNELVLTIIFDIVIIAFSFITFKIKRFKSGIASIKRDEIFDRLVLAGAVCIFGMTLVYTYHKQLLTELIFIFVIFCALALIIWWRKLISGNYKKQVLNRNVEILENCINELDNERTNLQKQNNDYASLTHRDNKLITSLELGVKSLYEKYPDDKEAAALLENLNALLSERAVALDKYRGDGNSLPKTEIITVDCVLEFLQAKANKNNTAFSVEVKSGAAKTLEEKFADVTRLNAVICDLGENALIAVKNVPESKVKIAFCYDGGSAQIKFFDNGAQFDENVISDMGRVAHTTHKSEGGSGEGLMSTFRILQTCGASFCLDETVSDGTFTKCIVITADGKGEYRVLTERNRVKKICAERIDFKN